MTEGSNIEDIFEEIFKIRKLLEILVRDNIKAELENVATTLERKKIWALCDGSFDTKMIAEKVGVSQRAVQIFIRELRDLDLVKAKKRGYPKRVFDYVPYEWNLE